MESLRSADCSAVRAVSRAESTERATRRDSTHISRTTAPAAQLSVDTSYVTTHEARERPICDCYAAHERPEVSGLALVLQRLSISIILPEFAPIKGRLLDGSA